MNLRRAPMDSFHAGFGQCLAKAVMRPSHIAAINETVSFFLNQIKLILWRFVPLGGALGKLIDIFVCANIISRKF